MGSDFRQQLDKAYQTKVIDKLSKMIRAIALVVDQELVAATPVGNPDNWKVKRAPPGYVGGRARSNWLPSLNVPDKTAVERGQDKDIGPILATFKITDTILITNNLPYIRRLNEGYSEQAPAGFVDMALLKGKRAVRT